MGALQFSVEHVPTGAHVKLPAAHPTTYKSQNQTGDKLTSYLPPPFGLVLTAGGVTFPETTGTVLPLPAVVGGFVTLATPGIVVGTEPLLPGPVVGIVVLMAGGAVGKEPLLTLGMVGGAVVLVTPVTGGEGGTTGLVTLGVVVVGEVCYESRKSRRRG